MADQFSLDQRSQMQLKKFHKKAPIAFQKVSAGVLNSMAFESRTNIQKILKAELTIRRPALLKRGLRVEVAKKSDPLRIQQSEVFSIAFEGFDGWAGAESGKVSRVTMFTDKGRVGKSQKGVARRESKAGQDHTTMSDYKLKGSGQTRTNLFIQSIARDKKRRRKSFYLPKGFKGSKRGVYKLMNGKVGKFRGRKGTVVGANIVRVSTPKDMMQPNKIGWMGRAVRITTRPAHVKTLWVDNFDHEFRKIKIR